MHSGGFSLIRLFTSFAMLGAEWVMWVLVALSVASVAVMLERARYYRSLDDDLEKLSDEVRALLRKGDLAGAKSRLEKSSSPASVVALAGLAEFDSGLKSAEEAMAGATVRVKLSLERYLAFLGTVGNNAPFVGPLRHRHRDHPGLRQAARGRVRRARRGPAGGAGGRRDGPHARHRAP